MYLTTFTLLLCQCTLNHAIDTPIWGASGPSAVLSAYNSHNKYNPVIFRHVSNNVPVPRDYFQYTAIKPQFAVDIATFHGVHSPEKHYRAHPIRPYTGVKPANIGRHRLNTKDPQLFGNLQQFTQTHEGLKSYIAPAERDFEVFHPYKAEIPALRNIYKDPVLEKIRFDLRKIPEIQKQYQKEVEQAEKDDKKNLEVPEETEKDLENHPNNPTPYEIYKPLRQPLYYSYQKNQQPYIQKLNKKFKHPLNQDYVQIKPVHYLPLMGHLQQLRQQHRNKYDDEHNEYPQNGPLLELTEPTENADIYENAKQKYMKLRNHIDEEVNKVESQNVPAKYEKLELQNPWVKNHKQYNPEKNENFDEDDISEFVPLKSYAQVRRTETTKHLPKAAALRDADSFEELQNAPRLREAVKSTKAQTIYSEEGYEDSAYDHAGEQKHASDHEEHAGHLKEHEHSEGKFKIPEIESGASHSEADEQLQISDKSDVSKDFFPAEYAEEIDPVDYADDNNDNDNIDDQNDENFENIEFESEKNTTPDMRGKREESKTYEIDNKSADPVDNVADTSETQIVVANRTNNNETMLKVPDKSLDDTFFKESNGFTSIQNNNAKKLKEDLREKYPYYFSKSANVNKDSPLRYSENMKFIPQKSTGGSEFYDSRGLVCPDVDEELDPVPDEVKNQALNKNDSNVSEKDSKRPKREPEENSAEQKLRLGGLGDKIDCFKAKFFGANPLDSPFFIESLISNPEPLKLPTLPIHKFKLDLKMSNTDDHFSNLTDKLNQENKLSLASLFDQLKASESNLQASLLNQRDQIKDSLNLLKNSTFPDIAKIQTQQSEIYSDIIENIMSRSQTPLLSPNITKNLLGSSFADIGKVQNISYGSFTDKKDVISNISVRKKRSAQDYQPYKIIRRSNRPTTQSPTELISETAYTSNVVHKMKLNKIPLLRNTKNKPYKEINRNKTLQDAASNKKPRIEPLKFVDASEDSRRGEPRYELKPPNHKTEYAPVENKKAMTIEEYKAQIKTKGVESTEREDFDEKLDSVPTHLSSEGARISLKREYFDVSKYLPNPIEVAASKTVNRIIRTSTPTVKQLASENENLDRNMSNDKTSEEEYEEYDTEEELPKTTTTTVKPYSRRKIITTTSAIITTTTQAPHSRLQKEDKPEKLRLITRFHKPISRFETKKEDSNANEQISLPKLKEKSKKVSESTVVTDSESYGDEDDEDDNMKKDEIDAMIHVKQNMDQYLPEYEKSVDQEIDKQKQDLSKPSQNSQEETYEESESESDSDNDDNESEELNSNENTEEEEEITIVSTTTERTLRKSIPKTTETHISTTEAQNVQKLLKPVFIKKRTHIHKELPVNRTAPRITEVKQDIKQEEVVKEIPIKRRIANKNAEVIDLHNDDNLAKKVNTLRDVEVFKENLDISKSPRHGGNYKRAQLVELEEDKPTLQLHGGNLQIQPDTQIRKTQRNPPGRRFRTRIIKKDQTTEKSVVKGKEEIDNSSNRDSHNRSYRRKQKQIPAKLIELNEEVPVDAIEKTSGQTEHFEGSSENKERGKNSQSEKKIRTEEPAQKADKLIAEAAMSKVEPKDARTNAAKLLSSFAQAVPILTTTPAYILDPSKRMYFYVDA